MFALLFGEEAGKGYDVDIDFLGADGAFAVGTVGDHGEHVMQSGLVVCGLSTEWKSSCSGFSQGQR